MIVDIDPDSPQGQIIRNWGGEVQTQAVGTREQQEQAARLSKVTGREVVLFEGARNRNGYFSRKDGKIHINVNGADPVVQIFSHELTHSVEGAKIYNALKTWAFESIQKKGGNLAQLKAEKMRLYEREGEPLDSQGAEKELVAEYVSQYLLTDEQTIMEVCRSKPTLGRQILNWLDRFLSRLGVTSKDRAALEHAKILYAKALNQTQSSFGTQTSHAKPVARNANRQAAADDTAGWTEMLAFRDRIQQELEAGKITDEEYDQYNDMADNWEQELLGKGGSDVQYSISEINGEKADYGIGVILDTDIFDGVRPHSWGKVLGNYVYQNLAGKSMTVYDVHGNPETIHIAKQTERVTKDGAKNSHKVLDKLARYRGDNIQALATVHLSEALQASEYENSTDEHSHQWMDENGWEYRRVYLQDVNGNIYTAVLNIANGRDRRILYSVNMVERIDQKKRDARGVVSSTKNGRDSHTMTASPETNLAQPEESVKQYSISDTSSKQDVVDGLKDILRRGGDINELRQFVAQVERSTPRAERNAPRADQNTREAERILRSAKQQGISVEEYLSQNWELYETENGWDPAARKALELEENGSRQYSFAGSNALTADDSLLASAKQMRTEGVDAETIRRETGWFVGKDGQWRFEIDDSQMELSSTIHNYMRLGELIRHDKLFAAYPDLAYIQVTFENLPNGVYGQYNRQFDSIAINSKVTDVSEEFKNALIHEIQHAIQNREGFTAGATVEGWNRKIERGFDSRRSQDIRKAQETEQKLAQIQQEQPDFYRAMMELEAMTPTVSRGQINWDTLEQIEEDPPEWQAFDARRDAISEQYGEMEVWDFMDLLHDRKRLAQTGRTGVELYYDTAGEIEARNVESRRGYTEEQRKNNPPRLGGEDTVLAEATRLNAQAVGRTNQNKPFVIIETDILDGVPEADWVKTVKDNLRNNYPNGITIGNNDIFIDSQSRKEMTYSKYMRWLKNNAPQVYGDKLRATNNADEILQATTGWVNEGLNHPRNDKIVEFARGEVLLRVGNNDYTAEVVVGKESSGKLKLYDLINLLPTTIVAKKTAVAISENPSPGAARNTTAIFDDTVAQRMSGVKQFSVGDTQTETDGSSDTSTVREQLPRKAKNYLERAERKLLRDIAGVMNAHRFADRSYLQEVVRKISEEYLIFGSVSQDTMDDLFTQAYNRGIVVDTEFYNQFKEVKDYLRTMSVTLAQRDTQNIADWFDFRRRAFGTLRIVNEGGVPVDTAYGELHTMAPSLFPESVSHPADQLVHMYEVGKSISKSEKSLSEYHGADAQTYRKWAKNDFEAAVGDIMKELQTVKRFADEKAAREAAEAEKAPVTQEEVMNAYAELKQARKDWQKATDKNLLSESDEMQVGRLLRGEILPEHLDESKDNVKGILAVYEAKREYERLCGIIGEYKRHRKGDLRQLADSYLKNAGEWVDKKIGLLYSRETMRRNIQDIVKDQKEAAAINAEFFDPVQTAEAAATRTVAFRLFKSPSQSKKYPHQNSADLVWKRVRGICLHFRLWRKLRIGSVKPSPAALIRAAFTFFKSPHKAKNIHTEWCGCFLAE